MRLLKQKRYKQALLTVSMALLILMAGTGTKAEVCSVQVGSAGSGPVQLAQPAGIAADTAGLFSLIWQAATMVAFDLAKATPILF